MRRGSVARGADHPCGERIGDHRRDREAAEAMPPGIVDHAGGSDRMGSDRIAGVEIIGRIGSGSGYTSPDVVG